MLMEVRSNNPLHKIGDARSLSEVLHRAQTHCRDCRTPSPMVCIERCDVWRVKNEILGLRNIVSKEDHPASMLNAIKNRRRLKILEALYRYPRTLRELQAYLRRGGCHHSRSTILAAYITPLITAGLVRKVGANYRSTIYGRRVHDLLRAFHGSSLPIRSRCYEETVLKELRNEPKKFDELASKVPRQSLSRILLRLRSRNLLAERLRSDNVFYHRVKRYPRMRLSPTEKRVFDSIPQAGIPVRKLSKQVGISRRRTYKYLRRLREKGLVFALKMSRTYQLSPKGREIADLLIEVEGVATSSLKVPIPTIQQ